MAILFQIFKIIIYTKIKLVYKVKFGVSYNISWRKYSKNTIHVQYYILDRTGCSTVLLDSTVCCLSLLLLYEVPILVNKRKNTLCSSVSTMIGGKKRASNPASTHELRRCRRSSSTPTSDILLKPAGDLDFQRFFSSLRHPDASLKKATDVEHLGESSQAAEVDSSTRSSQSPSNRFLFSLFFQIIFFSSFLYYYYYSDYITCSRLFSLNVTLGPPWRLHLYPGLGPWRGNCGKNSCF